MSKILELQKLGQSVWYDNIRRALLDSGELEALLAEGVTGVTSNPSIFEKAIAGSMDYDEAIAALAPEVLSDEEIYETLAMEDVRRAADLLRPVYEASGGRDGYVSLEVKPALAHDAKGTVEEARRLFALLDRPNVMIKVPATPAGLGALEELTAAGINVNVTLIFSLATYERVAEAFLRGVERLRGSVGNPGAVASVASFFVSRLDSAVDELLARSPSAGLEGTIAIANAKMAYDHFRTVHSGERWRSLEAAGTRPQRLLWASTGTKNSAYSDTLYMDALIGSGTVNTVPPATLDLFRDHGTVAATLEQDLPEARRRLASLAELGIDLDAVTESLQTEGLDAFSRAFDSLLGSVARKRGAAGSAPSRLSAELGSHASAAEEALGRLRKDQVMRRIWAHDHTVWSPEPDEIVNRLGWLNLPETMDETLGSLHSFAGNLLEEGFTHALLLGMGGSSLAPEMFQKVFGGQSDAPGRALNLTVLDSTDPDMIRTRTAHLDPERTLVVVATKSGGTVETLSAFKYLFNRVEGALGAREAGSRFVAITDPGSTLVDLAGEHGFRRIFLNDPTVGGRYAALSHFGLVPAALVGVDLARLLDRAGTSACNAASANCPQAGDNDAGRLGAILAVLAEAGRDKLILTTSPEIASFADWVEQLVAESTGKDGKGIVPVVGEPLGTPESYGDDRLFVDLSLPDDPSRSEALARLAEAGHPVVRIRLGDAYDLGGQFFLWEMATAVAGAGLGIHPFDQPNVEAAKIAARRMVDEYSAHGVLPHDETSPVTPDALKAFMGNARPGDYVALQAYVEPTASTDRALLALRLAIRDRHRLATTSGYGPRFLHSTGQLHKGDGGKGLFIQLTSDAREDLPIPDRAGADASAMSFQVLKLAQSLGDAQALREAGRRVIRFHVGTDVVGALTRLTGAFA